MQVISVVFSSAVISCSLYLILAMIKESAPRIHRVLADDVQTREYHVTMRKSEPLFLSDKKIRLVVSNDHLVAPVKIEKPQINEGWFYDNTNYGYGALSKNEIMYG